MTRSWRTGLAAEADRRDAVTAARTDKAATRRAEAVRDRDVRGRVDKRGARGAGSARETHRMRLTAHTASAAVLKSVYPWITDPGLAVDGPLIGTELFSRSAFCFSPMELYKAGTISSPNGVCIGEIGTANPHC